MQGVLARLVGYTVKWRLTNHSSRRLRRGLTQGVRARMQHTETPPNESVLPGYLLALLAACISFVVGVLFAMFLPPDQSGWIGLALAPLWLLLELLLEALVHVFSLRGRPSRLAVAAMVLAGFWGGALVYPIAGL